MRHAVRLTAVVMPFLLTACAMGSDSQVGPPQSVVSGTIHYEGPAAGRGRPLSIAVYGSLPPTGPPLRAVLVEDYEFPYRFTFDGLRPGTYYVGALIDVDRADRRYAGMLNPERDPFGYAGDGVPIVLGERRGVGGLEIRLEDPL